MGNMGSISIQHEWISIPNCTIALCHGRKNWNVTDLYLRYLIIHRQILWWRIRNYIITVWYILNTVWVPLLSLLVVVIVISICPQDSWRWHIVLLCLPKTRLIKVLLQWKSTSVHNSWTYSTNHPELDLGTFMRHFVSARLVCHTYCEKISLNSYSKIHGSR